MMHDEVEDIKGYIRGSIKNIQSLLIGIADNTLGVKP
jgi:hypothetical protein